MHAHSPHKQVRVAVQDVDLVSLQDTTIQLALGQLNWEGEKSHDNHMAIMHENYTNATTTSTCTCIENESCDSHMTSGSC